MNYRTRIISSLSEIGQQEWSDLLGCHREANPFLSYAFLNALHETECASAASGWQPHYLSLWKEEQLAAAMPLYVKYHSYGEYVFDWAWADAYRRTGLEYYPKLLSAIPFTPVTGCRLLARDAAAQAALIQALLELQNTSGVSSTHILYPPKAEADALMEAGFMLRNGVQFHWVNQGYRDFEDFLEVLERKKRKNIRAERRKVLEAGIAFRHVPGSQATREDWTFFKRCYDRTYAEHYSTPYLNLEFFLQIGETMPQHVLLVIGERAGKPVCSSLLIHSECTLYGRYWGATEYHPCLHFETAYYQPLQFCIAQGIACFEGGAQGEHKMARGFLPKQTWSAHWLAHAGFADAVERFLERENGGMLAYLNELKEHEPFRQM